MSIGQFFGKYYFDVSLKVLGDGEMARKLKVQPASTMTWVLFPKPTSSGSQPLVTSAPGDLECFPWEPAQMWYRNIHSDEHTHVIK